MRRESKKQRVIYMIGRFVRLCAGVMPVHSRFFIALLGLGGFGGFGSFRSLGSGAILVQEVVDILDIIQ